MNILKVYAWPAGAQMCDKHFCEGMCTETPSGTINVNVTSGLKWQSGVPLTLRISSPQQFKGVLAHFVVDSGAKAGQSVGSWSVAPAEKIKTIGCPTPLSGKQAITHELPELKTQVVGTWLPPEPMLGTLTLYLLMVFSRATASTCNVAERQIQFLEGVPVPTTATTTTTQATTTPLITTTATPTVAGTTGTGSTTTGTTAVVTTGTGTTMSAGSESGTSTVSNPLSGTPTATSASATIDDDEEEPDTLIAGVPDIAVAIGIGAVALVMLCIAAIMLIMTCRGRGSTKSSASPPPRSDKAASGGASGGTASSKLKRLSTAIGHAFQGDSRRRSYAQFEDNNEMDAPTISSNPHEHDHRYDAPASPPPFSSPQNFVTPQSNASWAPTPLQYSSDTQYQRGGNDYNAAPPGHAQYDSVTSPPPPSSYDGNAADTWHTPQHPEGGMHSPRAMPAVPATSISAVGVEWLEE